MAASNPTMENMQLIQALAGLFGYGQAGGTKSTQVQSGGTTTKQTLLTEEAVNALLKQIMEGTGDSRGGLASIVASAKAPGLYNSTSQSMLTNDLIARAAANVAAQSAPTVTTETPRTVTTQTAPNKSVTAGDAVKLAAMLYGNKAVRSKAGDAWDWLFGGGGAANTGAGVTPAGAGGGVTGLNVAPEVSGLNVSSSIPALNVEGAVAEQLVTDTTSIPDTTDVPVTTGTEGAAITAGAEGTLYGIGNTSTTAVPELSTGTSVQGLNVGGTPTTEGTFGDMFPESNYSTTPSSSSSSSSSSSGGSVLGAATGALSGFSAGKKNYAEDPDMWSQEDDFGTAHRDYRAEVGGGSLGGVMGYYGGAVGSGLASPVVDAVHPFFEDLTRSTITFGDDVAGPFGAMIMDPIGTTASGKYSENELAGSGFLASIGLGPLSGDSNTLDKVTEVIDDACFITTAVCKTLGKEDNCDELQTLRKYRDTWLAENHADDILLYYITAPHIVSKIKNLPNSSEIFADFSSNYITPAVSAIKAGMFEDAYKIYADMFNKAAKLVVEG